MGIPPKLSDAELVTLAVMQALLGFTSKARWLRHANRHLRRLFPYLSGQSGYNQRLRGAAALIRHAIRAIATDTALWTDDVWVFDSTRWSAAASGSCQALGAGGMGDLRLLRQPFPPFLRAAAASGVHPGWPPVAFALAGPRRPIGRCWETLWRSSRSWWPSGRDRCCWPTRTTTAASSTGCLQAGSAAVAAGPQGRGKAGRRVLFKPLRQLIESVNQTSRGSWTWNATAAGPWWVWVWVLQRTLALTAAIWHNDKTGQPTLRSLVAYDN